MTTQITDSGIYKITSPTGRIYIGQSINIQNRWIEYQRKKAKGQIKLNRSFLKHGIENHTFEIIELCPIEILNKRERHFQEMFDVIGKNGLNCKLTGTDEKKYVHSDETKQKMSESTKGEKHPLFGKHHTKQTRIKQSKARLGKYIGEQNHFYNKTHSKKSIKKMSESSKGSKNGMAKIVLDTQTGVFYECAKNVSDLYGWHPRTFKNWLTGIRKNKTQFIYA